MKCPRCGRLILAKAAYRTRTCPHCGNRFSLRKAMVVARASSSMEALDVLREFKERDKSL